MSAGKTSRSLVLPSLTASYKADTFEKKVNLGVGAYRDDDNKPWVLPVVRKASERLLQDTSLDHEYLPITGLASYTTAAAKLILGASSPAIQEQRAVSVQTISGTGANHLGALFLSRFYKWNGAPRMYISKPTWANHQAILKNVGIEPVDYPYYDPKTIGLDYEGFIGALQNAPERSVFLLHACAHNPTGVDPTQEQWKAIADVMLAKNHYAFFDCAYQGFASGDLDNDAWAVRYFVDKGVAMLVCQSFAKNAGLYGERVGALHVVSVTKEAAERVKSQLSVLQRSEISNPPTYGARVVSLILNDETLFEEWKEDIRTMAGRIIAMRKELHRLLTEELKTPGNWDHIINQIGMFRERADFDGRAEQQEHPVLCGKFRFGSSGVVTSWGSDVREIKQEQTQTWLLSVNAMADDSDHHLVRPHAPNHIQLPQNNNFSVSPDISPLYYTAPSSPCDFYTPPSTPPSTDDPFPTDDFSIDSVLDDEDYDSLGTLEKIYLFARSKTTFHRIYIIHALPELLYQITPQEAVQYVLPLLDGLAIDEEDPVKEALSLELLSLIWWFFTVSFLSFNLRLLPSQPAPQNCHLTSDDQQPTSSSSDIITVSVQAFTPILGTLLLCPNPSVGGATRRTIVDLLLRLKDADANHLSVLPPIGSLNASRRDMLRTELLQQVVIGMGRLDLDIDDQTPLNNMDTTQSSNGRDVMSDNYTQTSPMIVDVRPRTDSVNPYFPPLPSGSSGSIPSNATSSLPPSSAQTRHKNDRPSPPLPSTTHSQNETSLLSPERRPSMWAASGTIPHSPTEETLAATQAPAVPPVDSHLSDIGLHPVYDIRPSIQETHANDDAEEDEQATIGRLSSMSLMAALTASGTLADDTKQAFVKEVVKISKDPVHWVRREASFALGALAKVVREETVHSSLLPLFKTLRRDSFWQVRQSILFALPAILPRLSTNHRRSLALETILTLATDESSQVRCGVLEVLGEVLYTFHADEDGPPAELVELFLGRREDRRVRDGQQEKALELLSSIEERLLICAFNYPAVALTLGKERWGELREFYHELAQNRGFKVRRTLAASIGEIAKIIGEEHAQRDLVSVWWDGIRCRDEEVRTRAVESLPTLIGEVGCEVGDSLVLGLITIWDEGGFRNWREREGIAQGLVALCASTGLKGRRSIVALVQRALEDSVAAVREAAVRAVAGVWPLLSGEVLEQLRLTFTSLSQSPMFKRRMTFIACQHALVGVVPIDNTFLNSLIPLSEDPIDAVRIRLARLVSSLASTPSPVILSLVLRLSQDSSPDVKSYVLNPGPHQVAESFATFSRPPHTINASNDISIARAASFTHPESDQSKIPADIDSSHDHSNSVHGHPISVIPNADLDENTTPFIAPIPA
ncbi:hypothetical protein H0H92_013428 [Tricholoma furcatifolium]|nr:hypothetical protein H0H92_013428 [Tricholoma furcatifolium]